MADLGRYDNPEVRESLRERAAQLIATVKEIVRPEPTTTSQMIEMIWNLRARAYENINQIQHEYLILRAADWLVREGQVPSRAHWKWHKHQTHQTGGEDEPDLQAKLGDQVLASAEVTTSAEAKGSLRDRMKKTLEKLSAFPGSRYYFVHSPKIKATAESVVAERRWPITVVELEGFKLWD